MIEKKKNQQDERLSSFEAIVILIIIILPSMIPGSKVMSHFSKTFAHLETHSALNELNSTLESLDVDYMELNALLSEIVTLLQAENLTIQQAAYLEDLVERFNLLVGSDLENILSQISDIRTYGRELEFGDSVLQTTASMNMPFGIDIHQAEGLLLRINFLDELSDLLLQGGTIDDIQAFTHSYFGGNSSITGRDYISGAFTEDFPTTTAETLRNLEQLVIGLEADMKAQLLYLGSELAASLVNLALTLATGGLSLAIVLRIRKVLKKFRSPEVRAQLDSAILSGSTASATNSSVPQQVYQSDSVNITAGTYNDNRNSSAAGLGNTNLTLAQRAAILEDSANRQQQ